MQKNNVNNKEFSYEIIEKYGILSVSQNGWTKELRKISWNNREPKYDIREWSEDNTKMSKGITFTEDELDKLFEYITKIKE